MKMLNTRKLLILLYIFNLIIKKVTFYIKKQILWDTIKKIPTNLVEYI